MIPRNKNIGKVAINSDTNLSSSTEDLLSLAGKSHLRLYGQQQQQQQPQSPQSQFGASPLPSRLGRAEEDDPQPFHASSPFRQPIPVRQTGSGPSARLRKNPGPASESSSPQPSYADPVPLADVPSPSARQPGHMPVSTANILAAVSPSQHPPTPAGAIVVPALNMNVPKLQMGAGPTSPTHSSGTAHQVCRYYAQGYCSRGDKCNFLHTTDPALIAELDMSPKDASGRRSPRLISSPSRYLNMDIKECVGQVYAMCKDQHGCRFLQRKLDEEPDATVAVVFPEVSEHIVELMGGTQFRSAVFPQRIRRLTTRNHRSVRKLPLSKVDRALQYGPASGHCPRCCIAPCGDLEEHARHASCAEDD